MADITLKVIRVTHLAIYRLSDNLHLTLHSSMATWGKNH